MHREQTLMKSKTDLLCATDPGQISILILLDLSAVFDTVHHHILMKRPGETSEKTDMVRPGSGLTYTRQHYPLCLYSTATSGPPRDQYQGFILYMVLVIHFFPEDSIPCPLPSFHLHLSCTASRKWAHRWTSNLVTTGQMSCYWALLLFLRCYR